MTQNTEWITVYSAAGKLTADMVRLLLESFSISVNLGQESLGGVYGLTIGDLGEVEIQVRPEQVQDALAILQAMEKGELETANPDDENPDQADSQENDLSET